MFRVFKQSKAKENQHKAQTAVKLLRIEYLDNMMLKENHLQFKKKQVYWKAKGKFQKGESPKCRVYKLCSNCG